MKAYMNDIIIFLRILKKHIKNLKKIFELLTVKDVVLNPMKCFLKYSEAKLLDIKISMFSVMTAENKLKTIMSLKFPQTLCHLETYLGKTEYLRLLIAEYAQKAALLQCLKTALLKLVSSKNQIRKEYSLSTDIINSIKKKTDLFITL